MSEKQDISAMFNMTADAAEANEGAVAKKVQKVKETEPVAVAVKAPEVTKPVIVETPAPIQEKRVNPTNPTPIQAESRIMVPIVGENVSREFIEKILVLSDKYAKLEKGTQSVLHNYFLQDEEKSLSQLLRNAIYADESSFIGLGLISKIYQLGSGAQRAFFLMGVDDNELVYIYNELTIFVEVSDISGKSKLEACQVLEAAISGITESNIKHIASVAEFLTFAQ